VTGTCEKENCTVAATGKCLLSQPDPAECAHFLAASVAPAVKVAELKTLPIAAQPEEKEFTRQFHLGTEIGAQDANEIMRARYAHLIAILGSTDVGKTCFLSSLYLMASGGTLPSRYLFSGSLSLQAFEDRARGLREWDGGTLPSQLVDHTILADPRQPSLLHLGIRESSGERRKFDLLLTDLPGEWTDNLVERSSAAEAFRFLQRADGIILVVDGKQFLADATRHVELQRMRYFTERLANNVYVSMDTPIVILVSKSDEIDMQVPAAAITLYDHVRALGFHATVISASAFSRTPDKVKSGTGVFNAIETILLHQPVRDADASAQSYEPGTRTFSRFRG